MADYATVLREEHRLAVLQALEISAQYRASSNLLRAYLKGIGHAVSKERMEEHLAYLSEQGLIDKTAADDTTVATLTERGRDVADGTEFIPGVQRARPKY